MRLNILLAIIISFLIVSCKEEEKRNDKVEIYLTNKRIESYNGIDPKLFKDSIRFKEQLVRFNKLAIKLDTINNDLIFAGEFKANESDLEINPFINDDEILSVDFESSSIIMKKSVGNKFKNLNWKMGDDLGRQFVLCINKKPVLNGYFYSSLSSYLSNTYQIFIDDYKKDESKLICKIYFGKDLESPNLKDYKELYKIFSKNNQSD